MTSAIQLSSLTRSSSPEFGIGLVKSEVFPTGTSSLPFLATSAGDPIFAMGVRSSTDSFPPDDCGRLYVERVAPSILDGESAVALDCLGQGNHSSSLVHTASSSSSSSSSEW